MLIDESITASDLSSLVVHLLKEGPQHFFLDLVHLPVADAKSIVTTEGFTYSWV